MSRNAKRWVLAGAAVVVVAIVVAAFVVLRGGSGQAPASASSGGDAEVLVNKYLQAWASDSDVAASLTDDPAAARTAFRAVAQGFAPAKPVATLTQLKSDSALARVKWNLSPGRVWSYDVTLPLKHDDQGWHVHFSPAVIHPELGPGDRLEVRAGAGTTVTDRDGKVLDPKAAPLVLPKVQQLRTSSQAWSVVRVSATDGEQTLYQEGKVEAKPQQVSLSSKAQAAAQAAVDSAGAPALLVAIQPSTGDILAVAAAGTGQDNPLTGQYAPGSTFKIATAAAVLEAGVADADTVLPCPATVQLGQRTIPNDDQFSLAPLPLHSAFAHSCNTTFAQLASQLPKDALANAASQFGLNADFDIPGVSTEAGKVVAAGSDAEQVESAIGQGTVQASPFGLALMAATVASGKAVTPQLVRGQETSVTTGYDAPPSGVVTALRSMMREVVTGGTAKGLASSGKVYGKTGTAQFGNGAQANGWFAYYRDDVAFSLLVLGTNSSKPAVSASAAFLSRL